MVAGFSHRAIIPQRGSTVRGKPSAGKPCMSGTGNQAVGSLTIPPRCSPPSAHPQSQALLLNFSVFPEKHCPTSNPRLSEREPHPLLSSPTLGEGGWQMQIHSLLATDSRSLTLLKLQGAFLKKQFRSQQHFAF